MPDKLLFTPGPLTTSATVKQAMQRDLGSRDEEFIERVRDIRRRLLVLGGVSQADGYEAVLMQGSGTFGVEAVISSAVPAEGKLLVLANGAYGERMVQIAGRLRIPVTAWRCPEDRRPDLDGLQRALDEDRAISHVALVHCETSTGILNPLAEVGRIVKPAGRVFVVDAMSSFGAVPVNLAEAGIDYLVSSANKCLEGVPGFSFVLARREAMLAAEGSARSLSLDLQAQWRGLEADGQFRFTPPTHAILALARALDELEAEGGLAARAARYRANHTTLIDGMRRLGFREYLAPALQSDVITAFHYPADPNFRFEEFYRRLAAGGMVIYPGKLSSVDCFRIGTIGRIDAGDVAALLKAIAAVLAEMKVPVPVA